ncbi:MAG TPA: E3 binding domain-containing protein [Polyangiaceae bacterium]|jgi:pyruvate/2-oxoglutarate dehydrogenase complex dihydrolipoamide acyltransferase (E2) component|nr:E3 binding domain-containing protein [Polyangiaceae bacterium]
MTIYQLELLNLDEAITAGKIVKWLVAPGDRFTQGQPLVEVEADYTGDIIGAVWVTWTLTAPCAGEVLATRGEVGDIMPISSVLMVYDEGFPEHGPTLGLRVCRPTEEQVASIAVRASVAATADTFAPGRAPALPSPRDDIPSSRKIIAAGPIRRIAAQRTIDLQRVEGSGPRGLIRMRDLDRFIESRANAVLAVLAVRGIAVSNEDRARIVACTDAVTLDRWITRAASAASVAEVIAAPPGVA